MTDSGIISILLADDDEDDCLLFQDALKEMPLTQTLHVVHDGKKLMEVLNKKSPKLPDILFMDLTMPFKDGFECMSEIRTSNTLQHIKVVILSTHSDKNIIDQIYKAGANYYIQKPDEFSKLKQLVRITIMTVLNRNDDSSN